jgi:hypothetical protein
MTAEALFLLAGSLFGWLVLTIMAALCSALLYPLVRGTLDGMAPAPRADALMAYAVSAPLAAALVVTLLLQPELVALAPAHCHGELCGPHLPVLGHGSRTGGALVWLSNVLLGLALVVLAGTLLASRRRRRMLRSLSRHLPGNHWRLVDGARPLAWCEGLWRPQVYLSRGLVEQLDRQGLAVVIAHEEAHAARRDNLRKVVLAWSTRTWPRRLRALLRADLALAIEQACDHAAASRLGDPQPVAATLRQLGNHRGRNTRLSALAGRVHGDGGRRVGWALLAGMALAQLVMLALAGHPLLEWLAS